MAREFTKSRVTVLVFIVASMLTLPVADAGRFGFSHDAAWHARLYYQFFHASALHWFANAWALIGLAFGYWRVPWHFVLSAYSISCVAPAVDMPTVGLSGVAYALCGMIVPQLTAEQLRRYMPATGLYLMLGFALPVNAWLHVYCFLLGCMYGLLSTPRYYED